jgi:hypothetical protein
MNGMLKRIPLYFIPLFVGNCFAQTAPTPDTASVNHADRRQIFVSFDDPLPPSGAVDKQSYWIVLERTTAGSKRIKVGSVDVSHYRADDPTGPHLVLNLKEPVPGAPDIKEVQIELANDTDLVRFDPLTSQADLGTGTSQDGTPLTKADSRDDADVYVSGSYAAVKDGDPSYNVDAFAGYMWSLKHRDAKKTWHYYGRLGPYGQLSTKDSAKADPDSFLTYFVYQNVLGTGWLGPFQAPIFNERLFGAEFDRTGKELNLITSPVLTIPFRPVKPPTSLDPTFSAWPQFTLALGTEFVGIRKSSLAPIGDWHTRGLLGAGFTSGISPKKPAFDSLLLTSSWQVRLPSSPEVFYDSKFAPIDPTTGKKDPKQTPPMLGTQPRHNLDTKLTYNYTAWGGVTFEHTYGSLPPSFNKTDHTFTFGLTVTLKQLSYGRYSILRP